MNKLEKALDKKQRVMVIAWTLAREAADKYNRPASEYIGIGMRQAWDIINEEERFLESVASAPIANDQDIETETVPSRVRDRSSRDKTVEYATEAKRPTMLERVAADAMVSLPRYKPTNPVTRVRNAWHHAKQAVLLLFGGV